MIQLRSWNQAAFKISLIPSADFRSFQTEKSRTKLLRLLTKSLFFKGNSSGATAVFVHVNQSQNIYFTANVCVLACVFLIFKDVGLSVNFNVSEHYDDNATAGLLMKKVSQLLPPFCSRLCQVLSFFSDVTNFPQCPAFFIAVCPAKWV